MGPYFIRMIEHIGNIGWHKKKEMKKKMGKGTRYSLIINL